ncbi:hypothetical protein R3P38DRAFT_3242660 [Favolaschia claudopus]|uniref:Uncharacterized protein n=1 Tax=Favolaschia claudopus TaxID=2862362 RepID=A0AAV9Z4P1_9AGAR
MKPFQVTATSLTLLVGPLILHFIHTRPPRSKELASPYATPTSRSTARLFSVYDLALHPPHHPRDRTTSPPTAFPLSLSLSLSLGLTLDGDSAQSMECNENIMIKHPLLENTSTSAHTIAKHWLCRREGEPHGIFYRAAVPFFPPTPTTTAHRPPGSSTPSSSGLGLWTLDALSPSLSLAPRHIMSPPPPPRPPPHALEREEEWHVCIIFTYCVADTLRPPPPPRRPQAGYVHLCPGCGADADALRPTSCLAPFPMPTHSFLAPVPRAQLPPPPSILPPSSHPLRENDALFANMRIYWYTSIAAAAISTKPFCEIDAVKGEEEPGDDERRDDEEGGGGGAGVG